MVGFLLGCAHTSMKQGSLIFKNLDNEKRVKHLREHLIVNYSDVKKRIELGRIFLSEDMIEEAIIELEKVANTDSENVESLLLLSLAFQKMTNPNLEKSVMLLEKASQIEPNNADVHLNLGQVYSKIGDENKSINEFNRTIELSNDLAALVSAHLGLMAIYKKQGELEKANKEYESAYKIYPDVEEMIKQVEISHITPTPQYAGEEFRGDDRLHPSLEERIERATEEIRKILEKEK